MAICSVLSHSSGRSIRCCQRNLEKRYCAERRGARSTAEEIRVSSVLEWEPTPLEYSRASGTYHKNGSVWNAKQKNVRLHARPFRRKEASWTGGFDQLDYQPPEEIRTTSSWWIGVMLQLNWVLGQDHIVIAGLEGGAGWAESPNQKHEGWLKAFPAQVSKGEQLVAHP